MNDEQWGTCQRCKEDNIFVGEEGVCGFCLLFEGIETGKLVYRDGHWHDLSQQKLKDNQTKENKQ